jgi:ketosteroid isomerase-like protein
MRQFLLVSSLVILTTVSARAQSPSPRASLVEADKQAGASVFQQGIATGLQEYLAEDAILLYEGAPIVAGRSRVIQALGSQPALAGIRIQRLPVIVVISEDGNFGATTGASILIRTGQAPDSAAGVGHYIAVWRRTGEGAPWRISAIVENGLAGDHPFASAGADQSPPPPVTGLAREFAQADIDFAKMAADSGVHAAFGNFAAPDATTPAGESDIAVGPGEIRARMSTPARIQSSWVWHPVYAGSSSTGDLGFTVGEATIKSPPGDQSYVYEGKYLTVWRKLPDGSIKYVMDSGNARQ